MALAKARIRIEHSGVEFNVSYNPEEYSLNKDNTFASQAIPGLGSPILQFVHGNTRTLDMELFFDSFEKKTDVRADLARITDLLKIDPELHAPPVIRIMWGSLEFRGVLVKAAQKFLLFLEDGRPARARVNVTFHEFIDPEREAKEVKRQTSDFTKVHVVMKSETISGVAARHYGDARTWRPIAIANGIDDPRSLTAGRELRIPSLPFIDPESGEVLR
jgi:hypothetical protein